MTKSKTTKQEIAQTEEGIALEMSAEANKALVDSIQEKIANLMLEIDSLPLHPKASQETSSKFVAYAKRDIHQGFNLIQRAVLGNI